MLLKSNINPNTASHLLKLLDEIAEKGTLTYPLDMGLEFLPPLLYTFIWNARILYPLILLVLLFSIYKISATVVRTNVLVGSLALLICPLIVLYVSYQNFFYFEKGKLTFGDLPVFEMTAFIFYKNFSFIFSSVAVLLVGVLIFPLKFVPKLKEFAVVKWTNKHYFPLAAIVFLELLFFAAAISSFVVWAMPLDWIAVKLGSTKWDY